MKMSLLIICAASLLYAAPPESDILEDAPRDSEAQEIALFEAPSLAQQPIAPDLTQTPPPVLDPLRKQPWLAVSLSALFPGLGHIYLGDMKTAGSLMGTAGLGSNLAYAVRFNQSARQTAIATLQATSFYGLYAAYRDARLANGISRYSYPMPTDSAADLAAAPFRWSILKKPEVWGSVLGALALASAISHFGYSEEAHMQAGRKEISISPWAALPVGIGEESFFRGYLQSALSEVLNPTAGLLLSSLAFGAVHIPNAKFLDASDRWHYYAFTLPFITALGGYFGWLTQKNRSIQESVAIHTWYDFILFSLQALASETAATGRPGFALMAPF
jgi:membrane protease YdiL (CAAX protease family)